MQKSDPPPEKRQLAERAVVGLARGGNRLLDFVDPFVDISQHEVRRPGGEQGYDFGRSDVAAMDHGRGRKALQDADRFARVGNVTMRIADDSQQHSIFSLPRARLGPSHRPPAPRKYRIRPAVLALPPLASYSCQTAAASRGSIPQAAGPCPKLLPAKRFAPTTPAAPGQFRSRRYRERCMPSLEPAE